MTEQISEQHWMERALLLAKRGSGSVSPNPMVGAVIVANGTCIGEGYHEKAGGPHAEINAIHSVKDTSLLSQSVLYVTLEPCNHHGKTPPCTKAIIEAGIPRVVFGCVDCNPRVAGSGLAYLESKRIAVSGPLLEEECISLNRRFFTVQRKNRPYVILKWAQTKDGFIARKNYDSKWITGIESRTFVHSFRAEEDCIMVGTVTAEKDDPELTVRHCTGKNPVRIVLDRTLRLDSSLKLLNGQVKTIVINEQQERNGKNIEYWRIDFSDDLLPDLLTRLSENGFLSIFVEGGTTLQQSFIDQNLWDEARIFTGSAEFGEGIKAPMLPEVAIARAEKDIAGDSYQSFENPALAIFLKSLRLKGDA